MAGGRQSAFMEGRVKEATRGFVDQREQRPCFTCVRLNESSVFGGFEAIVEDLTLALGRMSQSEAELGWPMPLNVLSLEYIRNICNKVNVIPS